MKILITVLALFTLLNIAYTNDLDNWHPIMNPFSSLIRAESMYNRFNRQPSDNALFYWPTVKLSEQQNSIPGEVKTPNSYYFLSPRFG